MKVFIKNLYGIKDDEKAYYRKQGFCFDFSFDKTLATDLTKEEADKIISNGYFYQKQYNASEIGIED